MSVPWMVVLFSSKLFPAVHGGDCEVDNMANCVKIDIGNNNTQDFIVHVGSAIIWIKYWLIKLK